MLVTHEQFLHNVKLTTIEYAFGRGNIDTKDVAKLMAIKLAYGMGENGAYGVTYYNAWKRHDCQEHSIVPFVEIGTRHQRDWRQIATTCIHELAHVLAGFEAAHGKDWKAACEKLGMRRARAVGSHALCMLAPELRARIAQLSKPTDGQPISRVAEVLGPRGGKPKGCTVGIGTRGGKSRGAGSGSRLLKVTCAECGYTARVTRKWLDIGAPHCPLHGEMAEA